MGFSGAPVVPNAPCPARGSVLGRGDASGDYIARAGDDPEKGTDLLGTKRVSHPNVCCPANQAPTQAGVASLCRWAESLCLSCLSRSATKFPRGTGLLP